MEQSKLKKFMYNAIGMVCVVMGTIGVFVPLWPTTIFAIIASIMFAKANPKMQAWLLRSRLLGPYLQNYHNKTGITMAYKIRTCIILWSGLMFSSAIVTTPWAYLILATVGISVTTHVFWIRTRIPNPEDKINTVYNLTTIALLWVWVVPALLIAQNSGLTIHIQAIASASTALTIILIAYTLKTRTSRVHSI